MFTKTTENGKTYIHHGDRPVARVVGTAGEALVLRRSDGSTPDHWAALIHLLEPGRFIPVTRYLTLTPEESTRLMTLIPEEGTK